MLKNVKYIFFVLVLTGLVHDLCKAAYLSDGIELSEDTEKGSDKEGEKEDVEERKDKDNLPDSILSFDMVLESRLVNNFSFAPITLENYVVVHSPPPKSVTI